MRRYDRKDQLAFLSECRRDWLCPFCETDGIDGPHERLMCDGMRFRENYHCTNCGAAWFVYYRIDEVIVPLAPDPDVETGKLKGGDS